MLQDTTLEAEVRAAEARFNQMDVEDADAVREQLDLCQLIRALLSGAVMPRAGREPAASQQPTAGRQPGTAAAPAAVTAGPLLLGPPS